MSAFRIHPSLMQGAVISSVVSEQHSSGGRSGYQMTFILTVDHVRVGSGQHVDVARPQAEGSSHGVFIKIEPDLAHWLFALVPELSLPVVRRGGFMSEIGFNLVPIV
jgi:hypothetical protein